MCKLALLKTDIVNQYYLFLQFYVPFKIISAHMRLANQ